jgi:large subunit ribosomal protein L25
MSEVTIEVERRKEAGSRPSRRLRREGWIPAVVYGGGKESVPIQIDRRKMLELIKSVGGENAVFLLKLTGEGKSRHSMIRHIEVDPVTQQILHIDFRRVLMTEKVRVQIQIEVVGTSLGVKNEGGVLDFVTRELEVECLPSDIPHHLPVDVSEYHIGQHAEAKDVELPAGVILVGEPDRVIVSIGHPRVEVEEVVEEEEEELVEAEVEEPEVIRRGKVEEEGGEGAPEKS